MIKIKRAIAQTHQGPYLQVNEDNYEMDLQNLLFIICDGLGGSGIGDVAVKQITSNIKKFYSKLGHDPDITQPYFYSYKYLLEGNALINSFHHAHREQYNINKQKPLNERAAASALAVCLSDNMATLISTGNCELYLIRNQKISPLIVADSTKFFGDKNANHSTPTSPLSGIGLFEDLHIQSYELKIQEADLLLMASDGVWNYMDEEDWKVFITRPAPLKELVKQSLETANKKGNQDNQTLMCLEF